MVALLVPRLVHRLIIGFDTLKEWRAVIDFKRNTVEININNKMQIVPIDKISINKNLNVKHDIQFEYPIKTIKNEHNVGINGKIIINTGSGLDHKQHGKLCRLVNRYADVFREEPGKANCYEHSIKLTDEQASVQRTYPIPIHYREEVDKEIQLMLKNGIIERASSQYINPMVVVTKPNGSIRLCLDARKLNSVMIPDYECARSVEELFKKCGGARYMTKLDLTSGFWEIPIRRSDRKYTAFLYKNRCFQFTRVPFGLCTSLAAMVRCLDKVLGEDVERYTLVFVDDILCISKSFEEHLVHSENIFKKFRNDNQHKKIRV